jgi:putative hydrolase of HD superfamily
MTADRLARQVEFLVEIDKLKQVLRRPVTINADRNENSAEHSWHVSLMAALLSEYAEGSALDLLRTVKMLLVHDLVEIDAGDTYCYDEEAGRDKQARESRAARRIFAILPQDQKAEVASLWDEFEVGLTPEARFANALDRLQALLLNFNTGGKTWMKHGVTARQVLKRAEPIGESSPRLWEYARSLVEEAVARGMLKP